MDEKTQVQAVWQAYLDSLNAIDLMKRDSAKRFILSHGPHNPNQLDEREWEALGLDPNSAVRIIHYIEAGGRIRGEDDLERLNLGDSVWRSEVAQSLIWPVSEEDEWSRTIRPELEVLASAMEVLRPDSNLLANSGLSPYLIQRWSRFVKRGGALDSLSDLSKIYGMNMEWLALNKGRLIFPEPRKLDILSLNTIESVQLQEELDCPDWVAAKITDYRDRLGGYVERSQLWEVGLDSAWIQRVWSRIHIDGVVKTLNLNTNEVQELASHPYIGWELAKSIDFYRTRVRPIEGLSDLEGMEGYDADKVEKLKYYLVE